MTDLKNLIDFEVNKTISQNSKASYDWALNGVAHELYWWSDVFNLAFFDEKLPTIALSFDATNVKVLGHYVIDRNGLGIKENINMNLKHLLNRPLFEVLSTLLHEMAHCWQKYYGKPSNSWLHNKEFRNKLIEWGIECNDKGQTIDININGSFISLLNRLGLNITETKEAPTITGRVIPIETKKPKIKGKSKLNKWTCPCGVNVRVGAKDFEATCNKCGGLFERAR